MELVDVIARVAIEPLVRRRHDQQACRRQHPRELREHRRLVGRVQMLDRLERNDGVERRVGQAAARCTTLRQSGWSRCRRSIVRARIEPASMSTPTAAAAFVPSKRGAVAFAARGIEHAPALGVPARERVTVPVLVRDLAGAGRKKAFAGEGEVGCHAGHVPRRSSEERRRGGKASILPIRRGRLRRAIRHRNRPLGRSSRDRCGPGPARASRRRSVSGISTLSNRRTPSGSSAWARTKYLPGSSGSRGKVSEKAKRCAPMRLGVTPSMSVATPYTGVPSARTMPRRTTGARPSGENTSPAIVSAPPGGTRRRRVQRQRLDA